MLRPLCLVVATASLLAAADAVPLFNGKDLTGWKMVGLGQFVVENGMLKTEGGMGLLYFAGQKFGNQTIRVVYKTSGDRGNSGLYIRMPEPAPDAWYGVHNGYEVQIDGKGPDDWHSTGAIYSISKASKRAQKPDGEWNTMEVELAGPVTRVRLNGQLVNEYKDAQPTPERKFHYEPVRGPRPDMGYIGLQNHDPDSKVYFKEVSVLGGTKPATLPAFSSSATQSEVPGLTRSDRDYLLSYYHSTRKQVGDTVASLSPEQFEYKPAPEKWSVREVLEHLVLSEDTIFGLAQSGLQKSAQAPEKKLEDAQFVGMLTNRTAKFEAPPMLQPKGKWKTKEELLTEFRARRDKNLAWLNTTKEDLRNKYAQSPNGSMQVYHALLMVAAHTERHLAQAKEVIAGEGFPKK
ncbi:MAG TPA: DinB family protein [Bryobacteraceae bacterium]|nr:DinB family protein [Bryobacteraceae bacterium]